MENNGRKTKRIPWIGVALALILVGAIMFGIGWVSGSRGGSLLIEDGRLRVIPNRPGEIESRFVEIPDGDMITEIRISATSATIAVVPASLGAPPGVRFTNLDASVELLGNQLIIDTRGHEWRRGFQILDFGLFSLPREITVYIPAGLVGSVRIASTSGSIHMDGVSATVLEVRSTSGSVNGRNLSFTNGTLESTSGSININDVSWNNINVQTTSGRIRITGADIREGSTRLQVTSGNINLEVNGRRNDFTYSFTSVSGSVRVNGERLRGRTGTGGGGEHPITMNVTSGNIRLDFGL